jgi:hypothetical protein
MNAFGCVIDGKDDRLYTRHLIFCLHNQDCEKLYVSKEGISVHRGSILHHQEVCDIVKSSDTDLVSVSTVYCKLQNE